MSQWRKTKYVPEEVLRMLITYRGIDERVNGRGNTAIPVLESVLFPGSAISFREWIYRGSYRSNPLMSLELDQPYLYLLLDIPKDPQVSNLERKVWNLYVKDSIYGTFRYDMVRPDSAGKLIDEKSVNISGENNNLVYDCIPMLKRYAVTALEKSRQGLDICMEVFDKENQGVRAGKKEKWEVYKRFWQIIEDSRHYEREEISVGIPAFDEFKEISNDCQEYNPWLYIQCHYPVVPAWDYQKQIREFMDECNMKAWRAEQCVDEILRRNLTDRVINYLCRIKTDGSVEAREEIRRLYREFLLELFTAWDETMPKG